MLALVVCTNFIRFIFVAAIDYENIFTTKISRFMVLDNLYARYMCVYAGYMYIAIRVSFGRQVDNS